MCGGLLAPNTHWSEFVLLSACLVFFYLFANYRATVPLRTFVSAAAGGLSILAVALLFCHRRYWRHMQRYKPFELSGNAR
jgi:hypothetical protein